MNSRALRIIRSVIIIVLAAAFLTYFWWLLLIPVFLLIWYYIKTKREMKKAEDQIRSLMNEEKDLSDQIFQKQMKKQADIIDAEYTVHEEQL